MKLKRIFALLLALAMVFTATACTSNEVRDYEESDDGSETTDDTDVKALYATHAADTVVMTLDDTPVYWEEFFYWINNNVSSFESYLGTIEDWNEVYDEDAGTTYDEYLLNYTLELLVQYQAIRNGADELGITITEENEEYLDSVWVDDCEYFGEIDEDVDTTDMTDEEILALQEENFLEFLDGICLSTEYYREINVMSLLYGNSFEKMYGELGADLSDEDVLAKAEEDGYMSAKVIMFLTIDADTEEALDDDAIAEKYAQAEDVLAQLEGLEGEELEAKFDELMNELSEDPGLSSYPDGYTFTSGVMESDVEDTVNELEIGEVSGIVEGTSYYEIVLRTDLDPEGIVAESNGYGYTLRYTLAQVLFLAVFEGWCADVVVTLEDDFKDFTIASLYA